MLRSFLTAAAVIFLLSDLIALAPPDADTRKAVGMSDSSVELLPLGGEKPKKRVVRRIDVLPVTDEPAPLPETGLTGRHRVVIVMVEFSDRKFPAGMGLDYYRKLVNDSRSASLKSYYKEMSYGRYDLDSEVYGIYTINKPVSYYHYKPGAGGSLNRNKELIQEIANLTAGKIPYRNFDLYNTKGEKKPDGKIDHFGIIYPGTFDDIWPHRWGGMDIARVDGMIIDGYFIQNTSSPLGVIVHEFGHDIGLPDLYDIDYSSRGIGPWGTMALGSWANMGKTPVHLGAWDKIKMGWLEPQVVTSPVKGLRLKTSTKFPAAVKIPIGSVANREYYLVEYRQKTGYDQYLPNEGVVIWHVNEAQQGNANEANKLLDVVESAPDRDLDKPNGPNNFVHVFRPDGMNTFGPNSRPASRDSAGNPTNISIKVVSISGDEAVLDIERPVIPAPKGKLQMLEVDGYTAGQFWLMGATPGNPPTVAFPVTGKATVYNIQAALYYNGSGSNSGSVTVRLLDSKNQILYQSQPIRPALSRNNPYTILDQSVGNRGIEVAGDFKVQAELDGRDRSLFLAFTQPGSGRSSTGVQPFNGNFIIRAFADLPVNTTKKLRADDSDPLVIKMRQADRLTDQKQYAPAVRLYSEVLNGMNADRYRYQAYIAPCVTSLGVLAYRIKNYDYAIQAFQVGFQMAEATKAETQMAFLQQNLGESYYHKGDYQNALTSFNRSFEIKEKLQIEDSLKLDTIVWTGKTLKRMGRTDEAEDWLDEAMGLAQEIGDAEHIRLIQED